MREVFCILCSCKWFRRTSSNHLSITESIDHSCTKPIYLLMMTAMWTKITYGCHSASREVFICLANFLFMVVLQNISTSSHRMHTETWWQVSARLTFIASWVKPAKQFDFKMGPKNVKKISLRKTTALFGHLIFDERGIFSLSVFLCTTSLEILNLPKIF